MENEIRYPENGELTSSRYVKYISMNNIY